MRLILAGSAALQQQAKLLYLYQKGKKRDQRSLYSQPLCAAAFSSRPPAFLRSLTPSISLPATILFSCKGEKREIPLSHSIHVHTSPLARSPHSQSSLAAEQSCAYLGNNGPAAQCDKGRGEVVEAVSSEEFHRCEQGSGRMIEAKQRRQGGNTCLNYD